MIKKFHITMRFLMVCLLFSGSFMNASAYEQEFLVQPEPILSGGADRLDLRFNISHARVTFKLSEDPGFIVRILVNYDSKALTPISLESISEGIFTADFSSGAISPQDMANPIHDWEIQIGRYDLETNLTLNFQGVQTDLDMGGMPLNNLVLNLNGTQAELDFSEPTLFDVQKLDITCEGTFFALTNIAHTHFENFQLKAEGSSVELDFKGTYVAGDYNADFNLNGSSARISLPATAGALVVHRPGNRPVALAGGGWSKEVNSTPSSHMTDDYEERDAKLNLDIVSVAASVHIKREGTNLRYQLSY